jgi:5-methyltetrahydropteroyltriglutamate--homocysteine methyltransferase
MPLPTHLLPTTVVGSYTQPDWLVNRAMLSKVVPRTRMAEIWRIPEPFLEQAQGDATLLAIRDMERAGIDLARPGEVKTRSGQMTPVPRVVGKLRALVEGAAIVRGEVS